MLKDDGQSAPTFTVNLDTHVAHHKLVSRVARRQIVGDRTAIAYLSQALDSPFPQPIHHFVNTTAKSV
jgi:hypothetical protein